MKIQDITEGYGRYYCSTDKKWKTRKGPKQTRKVSEAFDRPYPIKWEKSEYGDSDALATLDDGSYLHVMFEHTTPYEVNISFYRNNSQEVTGEGDAQRVFATVLTAIQEFLKTEQPANISFSASKEMDPSTYYEPDEPQPNPESRAKLYNRLVQRYARTWGYQVQSFDHGTRVEYELSRIKPVAEEKQRLDPKCWDGYKKDGTKMKGDTRVNNCVKEELEETYDGDEFFEAYGELWYNEDEQLDEAEYQGRSVPLGKPMQGDVKKFKVYVKDPSTGNVKKVNFGDPDMKIKKSNPARRRSFRARHNCDNPGPRTKARYWSCRKW